MILIPLDINQSMNLLINLSIYIRIGVIPQVVNLVSPLSAFLSNQIMSGIYRSNTFI